MRPVSEQHLTTQYFCGCAGGIPSAPVDLTLTEGGAEVGTQGNADFPKHWNPKELNTLVRLSKHDAEFKEVDRDFRASLLEGFSRQYHMTKFQRTYHGSYANGGYRNIHKDPLHFETVGVLRAQYPIKWQKLALEKKDIALNFNGEEAMEITVYHGTSKDYALKIPGTGFSRYMTSTPGYGSGVYADPHGQISIHHALSAGTSNKGHILVCKLVYHKFGRTVGGDTRPPNGTDCGACCAPTDEFPIPCILVSYRDDQLLVTHVIEIEWKR
jgi:hypothetical protein